MKYQEKVAFLEGYSRSMANIQALQAEYERWETVGEKVTQTISPVPGGGNNNESRVALAAMEMAKISESIENEIVAAVKNRDAIREAINKNCSRSRYADVLTYKYISGLKNHKIGAMLGKETKTVSNIIHRAIVELDI